MTDSAQELRTRAAAARREGRSEDARRDLIAAVALCRGSGDRSELAASLVGLGRIERDMGRDEVALGHYREAAELYRGLGSVSRFAHTVRHVGDIARHMGRVDEADVCYREALGFDRKDLQAEQLNFANALRGYAILCGDTGRVSEAVSLWTEAREMYAAAGVKEGVEEAAGRLREIRGGDSVAAKDDRGG